MLLAAILAAALQTPVEPPAATAQQRLDAKLASDFLTRASWELNFDAARRAAAAEGRLILGYFTTVGP